MINGLTSYVLKPLELSDTDMGGPALGPSAVGALSGLSSKSCSTGSQPGRLGWVAVLKVAAGKEGSGQAASTCRLHARIRGREQHAWAGRSGCMEEAGHITMQALERPADDVRACRMPLTLVLVVLWVPKQALDRQNGPILKHAVRV